ncbi:MAG TPA: DUF885 domain-containing protein [Candidatus Limnocylindria bacterium]|nr:DUF885 domain-containing protein [Candidatus Limnocylindria bacterium]
MRLVSITALTLALLAPAPSLAQPALALPPAGTTSARLGALEEAYVGELLRDQPTFATQSGIHAYDDRLPDLSADGFARRIATAKRELGELDALERSGETLNDEDAADVQIMRAALERVLLDDEQEQRWKHEPAMYTNTASYAIYGLFSRAFAPLPERARLTIARERAIPALLAAGKANVTTVDPTTAELAKANLAGAVTFFAHVVPAAYADLHDAGLRDELTRANDATVAALRDYTSAMNAGPLAHPSGTFAIGAASFARRLALQEGRAIPLDLYERVGQRALDQTKAAFVATAHEIDPSKTPAQVYAELGSHHPAADQLLPTAQRELGELRAFVERKHLVTLPAEFDVQVRETPTFDRETSFASTNTPGAFEHVATQAYYYVTPPDPAWTPEQREQHLSFFNDYLFPIVSAHEVMPGHYVNFVLHKFQKLSLVRALSGNPSYSEGWAHYCEQMMVDEGWGNGDPRVRLAQLQAALQREARYLVGLREHTQGMSVADGTRFFQENAFLPEIAARREALRGTQDPLYGYYTLGKLEILKLREDYRRKLGPAYTLQRFHDAFLAHGNPPIAVVRKLLLGKDDDGNLL